MGFLLIFMWVATDHSMTKNNYNLLWALPTHLFISFFINSKKSWVKKYFGFTALAGILLLICLVFFTPANEQCFNSICYFINFRAAVRYFKNQRLMTTNNSPIKMRPLIIQYRRQGNTVILLHGFAEDSRSGMTLQRNFPLTIHLIVPDIPGSGKSTLLPEDQIGLGRLC